MVSDAIAEEFASDRPDEVHSMLRARDYFWRPWYAKAWWVSAGVFWILFALVSFLPGFSFKMDEGWGDLLALAFHPFTIVPVLGLPFVWAWRRRVVLPWDPSYPHEEAADGQVKVLYDGDGIGFHRPIPMSYMSDPGDVRSPLNPASPAYKVRHR